MRHKNAENNPKNATRNRQLRKSAQKIDSDKRGGRSRLKHNRGLLRSAFALKQCVVDIWLGSWGFWGGIICNMFEMMKILNEKILKEQKILKGQIWRETIF
jgi:hypothetical protein